VTRNGADETRFAGVVAKRSTDRPNGLAEGAIRDDDVVPDAVENVAAMYSLVPPLDEKHEQIEITRDERLLYPLAKQGSAARGEDEVAEAIPRHSLTMLFRLRRQRENVSGIAWDPPSAVGSGFSRIFK
jgi:hypothetical protein